MAAARQASQSELALLTQLGLEWASQCLPELLERAVKEELSLPRFLHLVREQEQESREERRLRTDLKLSGLPGGKTLDTFDFAFQHSVDKSRIDLLATSEFVRRKEVVLLLGPPGVGKSHLAAGLGVKAAQNGFSVAFMSADHLVDVVRRDAHLLFKVINHRYERGSNPDHLQQEHPRMAGDAGRRRGPGPRPSWTACSTTAMWCRSTAAASACGTWNSSSPRTDDTCVDSHSGPPAPLGHVPPQEGHPGARNLRVP